MRSREDETLLAGRIRDLARRAEQNGYVTHTGFLSLSEQSCAMSVLAEPGIPQGGGRYVLYGGMPDADRKVLFFLPAYMDEEELIEQEQSGAGIMACLKIEVRGTGFAKEIGHRDCLGALMDRQSACRHSICFSLGLHSTPCACTAKRKHRIGPDRQSACDGISHFTLCGAGTCRAGGSICGRKDSVLVLLCPCCRKPDLCPGPWKIYL